MSPHYFTIDAFAELPFEGNPAGVVLMQEPLDPVLMQKIANELGLSETAFVLKLTDTSFHIRWFTPTKEADLCGHATLAAAHALWSTERVLQKDAILFQSRSGPLTARKNGPLIELNFPTEAPERLSIIPEILKTEFGAHILYVGRNRLDYLVEVDDAAFVADYVPNFSNLIQLECGVIITAASPVWQSGKDSQRRTETPRDSFSDCDFVSRLFAPGDGIPEDPVTGSAHCGLSPYWSQKLNKTELVGRQLSARGGRVLVRNDGARTYLSGHAVTVISGQLHI